MSKIRKQSAFTHAEPSLYSTWETDEKTREYAFTHAEPSLYSTLSTLPPPFPAPRPLAFRRKSLLYCLRTINPTAMRAEFFKEETGS